MSEVAIAIQSAWPSERQGSSAGKIAHDTRQTLAAYAVDDALLRLDVVIQVTGQAKATIYRKVAAGDFPEPVRMGARCTRWRAGAVRAWLAEKAGATAAAVRSSDAAHGRAEAGTSLRNTEPA